MKLYTYWRSSAAYRVRIALHLKRLEYDAVAVHLVRGGGEQLSDAYREIHPQQLVPALEDDAGERLTQSLAIVEYLEERYPTPPLLPSSPRARARVRAMAQLIACEIHPLNNLRVLNYLTGPLGLTEPQKRAWYRHWLGLGFEALERMLADSPQTGRCCHGDLPTLADLCLVPQVYNARRVEVDLSPYPTLVRIDAHCRTLAPFLEAAPERQGDAESLG